MLKLMKYEFKKSWFSKIILLVVTGIFELIFLGGLLFTDAQKNGIIAIGCGGLVVSAVTGIMFIGIESMLTLHKDLNTKQSYMLFMTPKSSYQILGAKIVENALAVAGSSCFFAVLAGIDASLMITKLGGVKELLSVIRQFMGIEVPWEEIGTTVLLGFFEAVVGWLLMIVIGYLAIILCATIFAGKKFSGLFSFVLYIALALVLEKIILTVVEHLPNDFSNTMVFVVIAILGAVFSVLAYLVSCRIMDKKLCV